MGIIGGVGSLGTDELCLHFGTHHSRSQLDEVGRIVPYTELPDLLSETQVVCSTAHQLLEARRCLEKVDASSLFGFLVQMGAKERCDLLPIGLVAHNCTMQRLIASR